MKVEECLSTFFLRCILGSNAISYLGGYQCDEFAEQPPISEQCRPACNRGQDGSHLGLAVRHSPVVVSLLTGCRIRLVSKIVSWHDSVGVQQKQNVSLGVALMMSGQATFWCLEVSPAFGPLAQPSTQTLWASFTRAQDSFVPKIRSINCASFRHHWPFSSFYIFCSVLE